MSFAFLSDGTCAEDGADEQVEGQDIADIPAWHGSPEQETSHERDRQKHTDLDDDTQHERALTEDFTSQFFIEHRICAVGHQVGAFGRCEELVGKKVAVDDNTDGVFLLLLLIHHVFAFAPNIRWP